MPVNVQAMIQKYQSGVANGAANYRTGVTGKGTEWQTRASSDAAESAWASGVQAAAVAKRRQRAVQSVTGAAWEQQALATGAANYAASAQRAGQNYQAQANNIAAAAQAAQDAARAIAGDTLAARLQRPAAAATAIHRTWANIRGEQPQV